MKFFITGIEDALSRIDQIRDAITDRHLQEDATHALQPVVDDARALAPVDKGDLRDSIRVEVTDEGFLSVVIGDWKGHFFEFGTVEMRAHPMLIPAWEANQEQVIAKFGRAVGARIEAGDARMTFSLT